MYIFKTVYSKLSFKQRLEYSRPDQKYIYHIRSSYPKEIIPFLSCTEIDPKGTVMWRKSELRKLIDYITITHDPLNKNKLAKYT